MKSNKKNSSEDAFLRKLSRRAGVHKSLVTQVCNALLDFIVDEVNKSPDGTITVPNFGKFMISEHKGHPLNLNIKNGKTRIESYKTFKFKVSPAFKARVLNPETTPTSVEEADE